MPDRRMKIGDTVKHDPSGVEGRVIAYTEYEHDASQVAVQRSGLDNDNQPWKLLWFSEPDCFKVVR